MSADVESSLREIKEMLDSEEEQQREYEIIVGKRPSGLSTELTHEYTKNHKAHSMASDSNATRHRAMKLHIDNLKLLSLPLPELQSRVPSMVDIDEDSEAAITEMQTMIQKVEEMRVQRAMLCESLREDILSDDITKKLVQYKDENMSQIFAEELKKHDAKKRLIEQNICAQANILSALTEANAKYAETRRIVSDLLRSRETTINELVNSYHAFDDLLVKAAKGLEFYAKLDTNVSKLLNKVKGVTAVQQEERDAIIAKHANPIEPIPQFTPYVPQIIQNFPNPADLEQP